MRRGTEADGSSAAAFPPGVSSAPASVTPPAPVQGRWARFEDRVLLNLGAALLGAALLVMLYEAGSRFLLSRSYDWAEDAVRFAIAWAFFLCLAASARRGFHIRAEMLLDRLPPRLRRACDMIAVFCGLLFSAILLYAGVLQVQQLRRTGMTTDSTLDAPLWLMQAVMPVGAAFLLLFYLGALLSGLKGRPPFAKSVEIE